MNEAKTTSVELLPDRVIKRFERPEECHRELGVYELGLEFTPMLIESRPLEWIAISKEAGIPYLNSDSGFDTVLLARTVAALHKAAERDGLCLCHVDNQPANILWNGQRYVLIDFADSRMDHPESDISHLLLFWAEEYEPELFGRLAAEFINTYHLLHPLDQSLWRQCLSRSRDRFYERRWRFCKALPKLPEQQRQANQELLDRLLDKFSPFSAGLSAPP